MPNGIDQDRVNDTTKGGVVVNIADYLARAGDASTATSVTPAQRGRSGITLGVAIVVVLILCILFLRK